MYVWKLQIGWDSVMRMSVDLRDLFLYEAFLYYNPLLLVVSLSFFFFSSGQAVKFFSLNKNFVSCYLLFNIFSFGFDIVDHDGLALGS